MLDVEVAGARKLAVILHRIWIDRTEFDGDVAFRYLWCREPELMRWEGQCMGAVGEPRKRPHCLLWVRGRLKLQNHERSLPRVLDSKLRVTASPTRASLRWRHVKAKSCH